MTVTIHDVARRCGVSATTVSRALNGTGRVSEATRTKILAAAEELEYAPNALAKGLLGSVTNTVAVLVPDITNPFFPALVTSMRDAFDAAGRLMLLIDSSGDLEQVGERLRNLRGRKVDGLAILRAEVPGEAIRRIVGDLPIVCADAGRDIPGAAFVDCDHMGGARAAAQYLLQLGHRRIVYVAGPDSYAVSHQRLEGVRAAMAEAGVALDERHVISADFTDDAGRAAAEVLLGRCHDCTAILTANDLQAFGAMAAVEAAGMSVPDDVSVVGFDDIAFSRYIRPNLTTVHQPIAELGRAAATVLNEMIDGGLARDVTFGLDLVVRRSCRRLDGGTT